MEKTIIFIVLFLLFSSLVFGHDLFPPEWRGGYATTYQNWTFDSNDNPSTPEIIHNPYGSSLANITIGGFSFGWLAQNDLFGDQQGYWDLGTNGKIELDIPNNPESNDFKELILQLVYYQGSFSYIAPVIDVNGATLISEQQQDIEVIPPFGDKWILYYSKWRFEPNPSIEHIEIRSADNYSSILDQIVIDTLCRNNLQYDTDFNGDGVVNFSDFTLFSKSWREGTTDADIAPAGGDGVVNGKDLAAFVSQWLDGI